MRSSDDVIAFLKAADLITDIFKNRWRTLMSVDDVIAAVHAACTEIGVVDNTYFFYSSDHGFQLGEFNIPMDKRHTYDWDTHIHLLASGQCAAPKRMLQGEWVVSCSCRAWVQRACMVLLPCVGAEECAVRLLLSRACI